MTKKEKCELCGKRFKTQSALNQHLNLKHRDKLREQQDILHSTESRKKKIRNFSKIGAVLLLLIILGVFVFYKASNIKIYPPIDVQGHIEENPLSHIMTEPTPILIQKHMLEHADGDGPPGVVINYNCEEFSCEPDLIDKLTNITERYPEFVYLAPYPGMDAKVALTRLGRLDVLEVFDEERIVNFIENI